uniref:CSD domain-containing protein n=1 Tax=viral metagenome TaxID=1070528 RepID=A0A6C0AXS2_9ZZZZ|tara:strand:- start:27 stop:632 length:606 start_codon:yes stop_codon:yes gene_type:complete
MSTPETNDVSSPSVTTDTTNAAIISGRVKWFNNKAGYGFITVTSGDNTGSDVFVHHSAIVVSHEQYRYLVQGEYVEFKFCEVDDENHKCQAGEVKGINGGKLMCETRLETREMRMNHEQTNQSGTTQTGSSRRSRQEQYSRSSRGENSDQHYRVRSRGSGPREGDEWMLVRRRPRSTNQPTQYSNPPSSPKEVLRGRPSRQ